MAQLAKFHEKAIAIFGCAQRAEGISVVNDAPSGVLLSTSTNVATGSGTSFSTEAAIGSYIYVFAYSSWNILGRISSLSAATAVLEATPASQTASASSSMAWSAPLTSTAITGTISGTTLTLTAASNVIIGAILTGGTIVAGTYIKALASGTAGAIGATYTLSVTQTTNATAVGYIPNYKYKLGLGPKNAIAVLNLDFSAETNSEAFQYTGDELNRDELTMITDKYGKVTFETLLPVRGTIASTIPTLKEISLSDWFQSSGMYISLSTGQFEVTNTTASNTYMTIEVRRASADLGTTQKTYTLSNARGVFDLSIDLGTKPKLKFEYQGNLNSPAISVDKPDIVPDFENQKSTIGNAVNSSNINLCQLLPYTTTASSFNGIIDASKNLTVTGKSGGDILIGSTISTTDTATVGRTTIAASTTIVSQTSGIIGGNGVYVVSTTPTTAGTVAIIMGTTAGTPGTPALTSATKLSNIVFNKLVIPKASGYDYARYQTSELDGWSKGAIPVDVTITVLEDSTLASFNPDNNLENFYKLALYYADTVDTTGKKIAIVFEKIQLVKVSGSKVANYTGQDLAFRSVGSTSIRFY